MFSRFFKRDTAEDMVSSVGASVLSRLERLTKDDFQSDPTLKTEDGRMEALMLAAHRNRPKLVRLLLGTGCDPNTPLPHGATPLMAAATWGCQEVIEVLLEAGANPNAVDEEGMSALDMAKQMGHSQIAELLKNAGGERAETET